MIHRDLKLENILIQDIQSKQVKVKFDKFRFVILEYQG